MTAVTIRTIKMIIRADKVEQETGKMIIRDGMVIRETGEMIIRATGEMDGRSSSARIS